ncbi:MAG: ATP-binding protein [Bacteroidales bacterium]|nr:ATP-binding protein [Bacteroidales bacterium]
MQKSLQINSDPENLRIVENLIDQLSEEHKIESDLYGKILVATVEAVNNAIIHGNKSDKNKKIDIWISTDLKKVKVRVRDEGEGFEYDNIPDPTAPENIENIHGRGVFLMRQLSDNIKFRKKGSDVELTFKL